MEKGENFLKKEKIFIDVSKDTKNVSFNVLEKDGEYKASLQCEIDKERHWLIARIVTVEENFQKQGIGTQLLIEAIEYAKECDLDFVTDYGISEGFDALMQSLIKKGYVFVKNVNVVEKQTEKGIRFVTYDGSPVYTLNYK